MKLHNPGWATVVGLLLVTGLAAQTQQPPQQPQPPKTQEQAAAEAEQRQALQAINQASGPEELTAHIEEFLQKYPESRYAWTLCQRASDAFRQLRNYDKAIEYGERAIALNPQDPIAYILVADSLVEGTPPNQPDFEKVTHAEKYARKALELLPAYFATWQPSPTLTPEEIEERKKLFQAQPHATLGYIHLLRRETALAEQELVQATELSQSQPNPMDFLRLGIAYHRQQKYGPAVAVFRKTVAMGGPLYEYAQQYLQMAEEALAKSQPSAPAPPEDQPPTPKPPEPPQP
ncbi:MAG: tetratricopeptide repeat protein [Terriglobia bacterium]